MSHAAADNHTKIYRLTVPKYGIDEVHAADDWEAAEDWALGILDDLGRRLIGTPAEDEEIFYGIKEYTDRPALQTATPA